MKKNDPNPYIHIRIKELLEEKGISKNKICKDLELPRGNFNRYCEDRFQRIDTKLVFSLCQYFSCNIGDLLQIKDSEAE